MQGHAREHNRVNLEHSFRASDMLSAVTGPRGFRVDSRARLEGRSQTTRLFLANLEDHYATD